MQPLARKYVTLGTLNSKYNEGDGFNIITTEKQYTIRRDCGPLNTLGPGKFLLPSRQRTDVVMTIYRPIGETVNETEISSKIFSVTAAN